jgi:hypothetical protein
LSGFSGGAIVLRVGAFAPAASTSTVTSLTPHWLTCFAGACRLACSLHGRQVGCGELFLADLTRVLARPLCPVTAVAAAAAAFAGFATFTTFTTFTRLTRLAGLCGLTAAGLTRALTLWTRATRRASSVAFFTTLTTLTTLPFLGSLALVLAACAAGVTLATTASATAAPATVATVTTVSSCLRFGGGFGRCVGLVGCAAGGWGGRAAEQALEPGNKSFFSRRGGLGHWRRCGCRRS